MQVTIDYAEMLTCIYTYIRLDYTKVSRRSIAETIVAKSRKIAGTSRHCEDNLGIFSRKKGEKKVGILVRDTRITTT